jgi:hypothetical protein
MTTKHTDGEWIDRGNSCVGTRRQLVASVYPMEDENPEENAANMRLIAAAPDLLRYLKEARRTLEMWKDVAPAVSLCADIDAAIARATGESE